MANCYLEKPQKVTNDRIMFNKQRVEKEMENFNHISQSKRGHFNLEDLARTLDLDYNYLRKEIWKNGLLRDHAERMADFFGVYLEYLEGKTLYRNKEDFEAVERQYFEAEKRDKNALFISALEYFRRFPNINIKFVEDINREHIGDDKSEPVVGYKLTCRDSNYKTSAPIFKTIPEMEDFLQNINDVIEKIIMLHISQ